MAAAIRSFPPPLIVLILVGLALAGCARSAMSPGVVADARGDSSAAAGASGASQYVIGPGDRLGVFVYDNPQLSVTDLPVRPDGRISTPLVSDVTAAGQTPASLAQTLTERLGKYIKEPNVTVMVHEFVGPFDQQIRVIGEAAEPQAIAYRDHMTVLDVMILTKGLTRFAAGNSSVIVRRVSDAAPGAVATPRTEAGTEAGTAAKTAAGTGQIRLPVRLSDLLHDGDISQNVEMRPGDTLIIPQTWF